MKNLSNRVFEHLEADENIVLTDNCILMDAIVAGMGGKHKMFHGRLDKGVTLVLDLGLKGFKGNGEALNGKIASLIHNHGHKSLAHWRRQSRSNALKRLKS